MKGREMNRVEKIVDWLSEMGKEEWKEMLELVEERQEERMKMLVDELDRIMRAREAVKELREKS